MKISLRSDGMAGRRLTAPNRTLPTMSLAWSPPAAEIRASDHGDTLSATPDTPAGLSGICDLEHAPGDVRRVLGDLGRLLLAIPSYRVEPVLVDGVPMAAIRVERRDSNPVLIAVTVP